MDETIVSLSRMTGMTISQTLEPVDQVGALEYAGWAGLYEICRGDLDSGDFAAVIVGVWPDGQMMAEGFNDWGVAEFRWLHWWDAFRITDTPSETDLVVTYDDEIGDWILIGTGPRDLRFKRWEVLESFINERLRQHSSYRNSKIWYCDRPLGNYHRWEL